MTKRGRPGSFVLLGETIDVPANARRALNLHRPLLWLLLATAILDALSTIAFMTTLGVDREQNPLIRMLASQLGILTGTALGKLAQLLAVGILAIITPRLARFVITVTVLLNLFAYVVNMRVFVLSW